MDSSLYREQIIDLYERPLNFGTLDPHNFSYEEDNPLCGDVIRIDVQLDEQNRIADVKWSGDGCAISQASASLLTDEIMGMTLDEVTAAVGQPSEIRGSSETVLVYRPASGVEVHVVAAPTVIAVKQMMDAATLELV